MQIFENHGLDVRDWISLHSVKQIFEFFDKNGGGTISPDELKHGLRQFGKYYSLTQVLIMIDIFRKSTGSTLLKEPDLNLESFFRLLAGISKFEPPDDENKSIFDIVPSVFLDVCGRILYPLLFGVKVVLCFVFINTWCGSSC